MALSNIFTEPRREITETIVGIVTIGPFMVVDWRISEWRDTLKDPPPLLATMALVAVAMLLALGVFWLVLVIIHEIGDAVCNALDRRGVRLRPTKRYY